MKLKSFITIWVVLTGWAGQADVTITTSPADPPVYLNDLRQNAEMPEEIAAKGPWFEAHHTVRNNGGEPIELKNIRLTAQSVEGKSISLDLPVSGITLQPGEVKELKPYYFGNLPADSSLKFTVTASVEYRQGDKTESGSANFTTH